ncbi:hypothetical protein ISG33_13535 [Glaciecola sp. MH2013]|uniref:hypothetical protein n=1 Tax=Glaciecola sp. MH2013 TaxID=2785524 RepID=UPI0018A00407|nr:hypothetical protein [Glaciecola sp. MH2013]MBF7074423.1 hypothetical protein [Glaciecola sp. MH2013]
MQENSAKAKSKKFTIIALIVVFILPVILAKFALENDWFNKGSTNRGILLDPIIDASSILANKSAEPHWKLLYTVPNTCDIACENAVFSISQVRKAVGREMDRVDALFLVTESSDAKAVDNLSVNNFGQVLNLDSKNVNKLFNAVGNNGIFIVDTLGNVVLKYELTLEREQAIMDSRDILADLKKLLKLSRIG